MTLIVGLANEDIGFLVGDTLLTPLQIVKGNPTGVVNGEFHGLKIQILNDNLAIALASSNAAETAISLTKIVAEVVQNDTKTEPSLALFEAYRKCVTASGSDKPDCEFLVLQLRAEGNQLSHVTIEGVRQCERAYIGDPAQYRELCTLRRPYASPSHRHVQQSDGSFKIEENNDSAGQIEFMELSIALEHLIQRRNNAVGAIAGNIIRVRNAWPSGVLEYLQVGEVSFGPSEGPAGYSLLSSSQGTRGVGIYYKAAKFGFLMVVGDQKTCRKEPADTIQLFIDLAQKKYNMNLIGPT